MLEDSSVDILFKMGIINFFVSDVLVVFLFTGLNHLTLRKREETFSVES